MIIVLVRLKFLEKQNIFTDILTMIFTFSFSVSNAHFVDMIPCVVVSFSNKQTDQTRNKSNKYAMTRISSNQNPNSPLKTKTGNNYKDFSGISKRVQGPIELGILNRSMSQIGKFFIVKVLNWEILQPRP